MPISIRLTMLCLSGVELFSRWVPLIQSQASTTSHKVVRNSFKYHLQVRQRLLYLLTQRRVFPFKSKQKEIFEQCYFAQCVLSQSAMQHIKGLITTVTIAFVVRFSMILADRKCCHSRFDFILLLGAIQFARVGEFFWELPFILA